MTRNRDERGEIKVIAAPMFAGKSSRVIAEVDRYWRARMKVKVFKHPLDDRYSGVSQINSHDGRSVACDANSDLKYIYESVLAEDADVVIIDEAQFYIGSDELFVALVEQLASDGRIVILAGLELDFRGEGFGPMPQLLAHADKVEKLTAVCVNCGSLDANRTQRIINGVPARYDDPIVLVGAEEAYEARCAKCHTVPGKPSFVELLNQVI